MQKQPRTKKMATSKPNQEPSQNPKNPKNPKDIESLQSDIASFASSLGLTSSFPSSGFNDVDFRKKGPMKNPPKPQTLNPPQNPKRPPFKPQNPKYQNGPVSDDSSKPFNRFKNLPKLPLAKASAMGVWHVDAAELEVKVMGEIGKKPEGNDDDEWRRLVKKKRELGERLLAQFTQDFDSSRGNSGDFKMLMATLRSGTAIDKVSAHSVMVGENPIANIRSLDALLAMVTSKVGKHHAVTGFDALKELFLSSLLPDRKLRRLDLRPVNHLPESKDGYSLLLFWYWEDCLKERYGRFVSALEEASRDLLPILKDKASKAIYSLLKGKPEQEGRLLSALVNKLGDPQDKAASNADFHLANLLSDNVHPNFKEVVVNEVASFISRRNIGPKAMYRAVNFLNQIYLTNRGDGPKIAKRLVDIYCALFKVLIGAADNKNFEKNKEDRTAKTSLKDSKEKGPAENNEDTDSRLLTALLAGVSRAFPFIPSDEADDVVEVQTPMLFKLVHSNNFNVGIRALQLLENISSKHQVVSDRFYRALYSKLLLPSAMNSSKAEMFVGILSRTMKNDVNLKRVSAFSKRLMQVALQQRPEFACAYLFLLSEVLKARPPLWNMVLQNESIDDDFEHFEDVMEEPEARREYGPSKQPENFDVDVPNNNNVVEDTIIFSDSEEVKHHLASDSDGSDGADDLLRGENLNVAREFKKASNSVKDEPQSILLSSLPGGYDPHHREPCYCHAERASWWELMVLASHVHPSVSTMAKTLLSGANIIYNGNPVKDLSLTSFLDKFMEKKPKKIHWHGGSQIEPSKKLDTSNHLIGPEILSLDEEDVPPEDLVFHKFYMHKMNSSKKPKKKKKKGKGDEAAEDILGVDEEPDSDEEIGGDESDNEEIDSMLESGDIPWEADGGYDYDELDQVADKDDDDLVGSESDADTDVPSDLAEDDGENDDGTDDFIHMDNGDEDEDQSFNKRKGKRKSRDKTGASPFASLEEYDHLLNEEGDGSTNKKKPKSQKKRRSSN